MHNLFFIVPGHWDICPLQLRLRACVHHVHWAQLFSMCPIHICVVVCRKIKLNEHRSNKPKRLQQSCSKHAESFTNVYCTYCSCASPCEQGLNICAVTAPRSMYFLCAAHDLYLSKDRSKNNPMPLWPLDFINVYTTHGSTQTEWSCTHGCII